MSSARYRQRHNVRTVAQRQLLRLLRQIVYLQNNAFSFLLDIFLDLKMVVCLNIVMEFARFETRKILISRIM